MRQSLSRFLSDQSGAVTVDWTVITGATMVSGLMVSLIIALGTSDVSHDTADLLTGYGDPDAPASPPQDLTDVERACALGADAARAAFDATGRRIESLLVYQASDFVSGVPNEKRGIADLDKGEILVLRDGATPIRLNMTDDNRLLEERAYSQKLATDTTISGKTYEVGDRVSAAYHLSAGGLTLTGLQLDADPSGRQSGPMNAIAVSFPLEPGRGYALDGTTDANGAPLSYDAYAGCGTVG